MKSLISSKCPYKPKQFRFNVILIKISRTFLVLKEVMLKFIWKHTRCQGVKSIINNKNKAEGITASSFKT